MICMLKYRFVDIRQHEQDKNENEQAGYEHSTAQVKLGLAKIEIFFHLIEN